MCVEKYSLSSQTNRHPVEIFVTQLEYIADYHTSNSKIGALTFRDWNSSAVKVNPHTATQ